MERELVQEIQKFIDEKKQEKQIINKVIRDDVFSVLGSSYKPALMFIMPPGAFITLGFLIAGFRKLQETVKNRSEKSKEACKE